MTWLSARRFKEFRNHALSGLTAGGVKLLFRTIRVEARHWEPLAAARARGEGFVFALWHQSLMLVLGHESCRGTTALISPTRDGEFAVRVLSRFGIAAVRGSSSKQPTAGTRRLLRAAEAGRSFAVTPDGPRGPRHLLKPGVVFLAARLGLPVVPVGAAASRARILRSWDAFRIPKPFSRVALVFGEPIRVTATPGREGLDEARARLEAALLSVSEDAARVVGQPWPDPPVS